MYSHFARQHLEARLFQRFNASRREGREEFDELRRSPQQPSADNHEENEDLVENVVEDDEKDILEQAEQDTEIKIEKETTSRDVAPPSSVIEEERRQRSLDSKLDAHKHNQHHITIPYRDTPPTSIITAPRSPPSFHNEEKSHDTIIDLSSYEFDYDFSTSEPGSHAQEQSLQFQKPKHRITKYDLGMRVLSALFWGFTMWRCWLVLRMLVGVFVYR